ncbi:GNAT family N-acetyltransferase [Sphingomonas sp. KR1UV-12]|uniref:GNAT family N-acetyltransferase n=1 Tax=Sphingomonas aurea TaxID=3063994 RepID=A0ABT9EH30_9SPHN|nr:GNAT family N-acetyltransferase [Sphingomonas sp. KR1UV-12]MDP1026152.1 GNAT family N-acetyltransferase [Sphingomonas sp. KR1UV-12]
MTDWRLRRASPADAPAVALVAAASFLETFAGILSGADIIAHLTAKSAPATFAAWAEDFGSVVTLAEHENGAAPVGYTVLTAPQEVGDTGPGDIELRRIYTLSTARSTGLGAALMEQALDDARALGANRMLLGVFAGNARACAFYERQGFVVAERRRFKVGATWHDDLVYARQIQGIPQTG